eukprot:gnl/MRDRNA2_/MRDRNA2_69867_c0_seq2.p1 gnl/MRDRNA2_/MRDRNA2_69867_c0~~gnl/MRDRNA2_/MRDRNA2_69867_c0_seq2.p1  ORF type:complete len:234 (-),score=46.22 gnl/MRDRNA2_/MRDRNA2_69867_c0_seq2:527-1228(-)
MSFLKLLFLAAGIARLSSQDTRSSQEGEGQVGFLSAIHAGSDIQLGQKGGEEAAGSKVDETVFGFNKDKQSLGDVELFVKCKDFKGVDRDRVTEWLKSRMPNVIFTKDVMKEKNWAGAKVSVRLEQMVPFKKAVTGAKMDKHEADVQPNRHQTAADTKQPGQQGSNNEKVRKSRGNNQQSRGNNQKPQGWDSKNKQRAKRQKVHGFAEGNATAFAGGHATARSQANHRDHSKS